MKHLLLLIVLLISPVALAADPIETGTFNNKAIYGYDTVAYFTQGKPVKGSDEFTSDWRGAVWYFSSSDHKAIFDNAPEQYAPQYGGHCAYAMSRGRFVGIDEDAFTIVDGKLYLNYSRSVQADWLENRDSFIADADKAYQGHFSF